MTIHKTNKIAPINKRFDLLNERMMKSVGVVLEQDTPPYAGAMRDPRTGEWSPGKTPNIKAMAPAATGQSAQKGASLKSVVQTITSNFQNFGVVGFDDPKTRAMIEVFVFKQLEKAGILDNIIDAVLASGAADPFGATPDVASRLYKEGKGKAVRTGLKALVKRYLSLIHI